MLVWETDPSMRDNELRAALADVWCAIPKVVFSRTLDSVQGNARLAEASVAEEAAGMLDAADKDVSIGGAGLAAAAIELGLVDELRMFRYVVSSRTVCSRRVRRAATTSRDAAWPSRQAPAPRPATVLGGTEVVDPTRKAATATQTTTAARPTRPTPGKTRSSGTK